MATDEHEAVEGVSAPKTGEDWWAALDTTRSELTATRKRLEETSSQLATVQLAAVQTGATRPTPFWWPDTRALIVSWMMVSSFAILVLCWWRPPPAEAQLLNTLVGMYVGTGFITAITWWMGSSKDSGDKTQTIKDMASKDAAEGSSK